MKKAGATRELNKLIAVFDGWQVGKFENLPNKLHKMDDIDLIGIHIDYLNYHESFELLIPVVEKIETMQSDLIDCRVTIEGKTTRIYYYSGDGKKYEWTNGGETKLKSVWKAVVRFIKWFNQNK